MVDKLLGHLDRLILVLLRAGEGPPRWGHAGSQHSRDGQGQQQQQSPHVERHRRETNRGATPADSFIQSSHLNYLAIQE